MHEDVTGKSLSRIGVIGFMECGVDIDMGREAALVGAHIATMPFSTFKELMGHRLTRDGMKKFTEDAPEEYRKLV